MTNITQDITDEALVERIRSIQAELRELDGKIVAWSDQVENRRTLIRNARDRVFELNGELHQLVAVEVCMGTL